MSEPEHGNRPIDPYPQATGSRAITPLADAARTPAPPGARAASIRPHSDQFATTQAWHPHADLAPDPLREETNAAPGASTPGPDAHDRGTRSESTEPMGEPVSTLPRLPPIPGYRVQSYVGRGGMGIVYRAVHRATGRTVALKVVNPSGAHDRVARERFSREVHALAALKHPNIVPVYDAGDWHGFPYCAMEFVPGGTLSEHLDRVRGDLRSAVRLMAKVARAVAALHTIGVLHRDLKPLNILLADDDEPMVADFGLARWADEDSDLTYTGLPVGTRSYMAPEQTFGRREDYTPACDIWALGVTLYEVLTGQRPFSEDGVTEVSHRIRYSDPPPVASHAPGVPAELEAVARKCLEKRPEDRYASAAAVADDLERWLAGEPLSVRAAPAPLADVVPQPAKKPVPRVPRVVAGACVLLIAVVVASLGGAFRKPAPPPQTLAQRVTAGEKLRLTDEKGAPTVPWTPTEGHPLMEKGTDGYHWFGSKDPGLAALADEPWELPIRVEADVAVKFQTWPWTRGGVYVGRKVWTGLEFKHESLVWFGVTPRHDPEQADPNRLIGRAELYWWDRDRSGSSSTWRERVGPWNRNGKAEDPRFARVVIEIHEKELKGSVDGMALDPVVERWALDDLDRKFKDRRFPQYTFDGPAFGTGIGVFCQNADCVVRDLTVSKLNP